VNTSFKVTVGIPNGINCAPLVVSFFYSNEEDFIQGFSI